MVGPSVPWPSPRMLEVELRVNIRSASGYLLRKQSLLGARKGKNELAQERADLEEANEDYCFGSMSVRGRNLAGIPDPAGR